MHADREDELVREPARAAHHVEMSVGDGVEGAGVERNTGHGKELAFGRTSDKEPGVNDKQLCVTLDGARARAKYRRRSVQAPKLARATSGARARETSFVPT